MDQEAIEKVLLTGDLAALTPDQRLSYYNSVCKSLKLNPLTQPFGYIKFEGRLQLYARKDATEQLRNIHKVSITDLTTALQGELYIVTAKAINGKNRTDVSTGVVATTTFNEAGEKVAIIASALANLLMKAETKAKRRVTLSICGLGILDETEIEHGNGEQRQLTEGQVAERNVKAATANATTPEVRTNSAGKVTGVVVPNGDLGDTKVHIGKAEGNMLGKKVSELPDEILKWLKDKWIERLGPSASDQDYKLKKAVMAEIEKRKAAPTPAPAAQTATPASADTTPPPSDDSRTVLATGERAAMLNELAGKVEELVMTPVQFCGYLQLAGLEFHGKTLAELSDGQLKFLLKSWDETKKVIEAAMKPKIKDEPKKGRKKGRGRAL